MNFGLKAVLARTSFQQNLTTFINFNNYLDPNLSHILGRNFVQFPCDTNPIFHPRERFLALFDPNLRFLPDRPKFGSRNFSAHLQRIDTVENLWLLSSHDFASTGCLLDLFENLPYKWFIFPQIYLKSTENY